MTSIVTKHFHAHTFRSAFNKRKGENPVFTADPPPTPIETKKKKKNSNFFFQRNIFPHGATLCVDFGPAVQGELRLVCWIHDLWRQDQPYYCRSSAFFC